MLRIALLFLVTTFINSTGIAQIKGVTETGDEVILYPNGTWKYSNDFSNADTIANNTNIYKRNPISTFLLKSEKGNLGFYIDPKKWNFKKALPDSDAEYTLDLKGQSLQATIITETTEIPLESYVSIALENGKSAAPDIQITKKEYRTVNNLKVLYMQMEGTQAGIKFAYSGYYYSAENITMQFVVFTYKNSAVKYAKDIEELLNGLVELKGNKPTVKEKVDAETAVGNLEPQGSFSSTNNCKPLFTGRWRYSTINADNLQTEEVTVDRSLQLTTEMTESKNYTFQYATKWITDCSYELTFIKTTKPNFDLIKTDEVIAIEITFIDKDLMKYRSTFRGKNADGEMYRVN